MTIAPVQLALGVQLSDTATLDNLVAGDNAQVIAACEQLATKSSASANVYLWGAPGSGKSHLLQAVSRRGAQFGQRIAYLPLSEICTQSPALLDGLHNMHCLCLDELDAIAGNRAWEVALVGLFDQCRLGGCGLLAAGPRAPAELGLQLKDLSSRLAWGAVYALRDLNDTDKCRVLRERASCRGLHMPADVADFLLHRFTRDLPGLLAILDRLDQASLAAQRRLTIPFAKQVLEV